MADLITRPETRSETATDSLAERLLDTQSPQRPQSSTRIRIEVDGRVVEGFEGQTILEVCRDNGIEIPTLCYEPKLPGFGACRMCVVEVEGEEHPPISCSRVCEPEMKVQTQTEEVRRLRRTNLELIFSDHNAYCLPPCQNKCPSHIDIPGFLKANAEADWRESTRIFKRTIPFPSVLGRVCPAPCEEHCRRDEVDEAIAIRDSHRYAGDQVLKSMLDEGVDPPLPYERQAPTGRRAAVEGLGFEALGIEISRRGIEVDEQMRAADGVWAAGDVTGIAMFTHAGKYQARVAAADAAGRPARADHRAVPAVTFTDPQVASVGTTTGEGLAVGERRGTARLSTYERPKRPGFLKVFADPGKRVLVGACAVGPEAGEWLGQLTLAIRAEVPIDILLDTIQPYPTFSEAVFFAVRDLDL